MRAREQNTLSGRPSAVATEKEQLMITQPGQQTQEVAA
jgi:hypothetical protein